MNDDFEQAFSDMLLTRRWIPALLPEQVDKALNSDLVRKQLNIDPQCEVTFWYLVRLC